MNLLELRTETRRMLAETTASASYSSDDDLDAYINEGIKDMCIKAKVFERTKSTTIANGTATYNLPFDFLFPHALRNPSGNNLMLTDATHLGELFLVTGKPTFYYVSQTPLTTTTRGNSSYYAAGTILSPLVANGYIYEVMVAGITAGSIPAAYSTALPGDGITDGAATVACREMTVIAYTMTLVDTPTTVGGGTGTYVLTYKAMDQGLHGEAYGPSFPEDKHHYLVLFAMYRHFTKMKDGVRASQMYSDYAGGLGISQVGQGGN